MVDFYMMVGLPGTGKSTWTDNYIKNNWNRQEHFSVISTDDIITDIGSIFGFTYNQVFDTITYSFAEKMSYKLARMCFERGDVVVWDQTNLTKKSREKKLKLIPSHYKKICVNFSVPSDHKERLNRPGKIIQQSVIDGMAKNYQEPTLDEGFDEIIRI